MIKQLSHQVRMSVRLQFKNFASGQHGLRFLKSIVWLNSPVRCHSTLSLNRHFYHTCLHRPFSIRPLFYSNIQHNLGRRLAQSPSQSSITISHRTQGRSVEDINSDQQVHLADSLKLRRISDSNLTQIVAIPGRINQILPSSLLPYAQLMRLDKQTGTALLLYPCLWSISLAALPGHMPNLQVIALFTIGAVLMRSAGCIVNDMWDRKIDMQVERTQTRPLACGSLTMVDAWCLLSTCLTGALHILLSFDKLT